MNLTEPTFTIFPIGYVKRTDDGIRIEIKEKYIPSLKELEQSSHIHVIWWMHKADTEEYRFSSRYLQHKGYFIIKEDSPIIGVFASRSPIRPNPIGMSIAKILEVDHENGIVTLQNLDAIDNTPVLDLKPYEKFRDRVKDSVIPKYLDFFENAEWAPEDGWELDLECIKLFNEGRINEYSPTSSDNENE
jgi:tRNA-Thr(GGU) m(6)t(6)A37 methyltransferase TsaA